MVTPLFKWPEKLSVMKNMFFRASLALPSILLAFSLALTPAQAQVCIDDDGDGWGWDGEASCLVEQVASAPAPVGAACVDDDGDGWGWDGQSSCLLEQTAAGAQSGTGASSDCIDDDGDGWGWDGQSSCLVVGSAIAPAIAPSDCADDDGDGWGWNGQSTCRVEIGASSAPTPGGGRCVDDDGDGWGWDGQSSCLASAAAIGGPSSDGPAAITDLILVTGQSNALGAGTQYDPALDSGHQQVFAFTDSGWRVADLRQVWDLGWHPRTDPNTDPGNNFALHFGVQLVRHDRARVVGFILATAPGQPISHWAANGDFFNFIRAKVSNAINQLPHKSRLDGILFHQGESDGNDDNSYGHALRSLIGSLRSEPWFDADKPFICGETAGLAVNNQLNSLNRDGDPNTACVAASNLPTSGDRRHFTAEALRELGRRYADRYDAIVN